MHSPQRSLTQHPIVRFAWGAFCVAWVGVTAWLLYYFTFANYGEFDPNQAWLGTTPTLTLSQLTDTPSESGLSLVHVRSRLCSCNPLADAHTATIPEHVNQHWVDAKRVSETGFVLPATPAALIFSEGELIYAGPYASGAFCAVEDSLIEDILNGSQQLAGSYLNGLVRACRCLTSEST